MTTIIVIVVVALVFFVAVCVGGFMVLKNEAEMRTDSIKAIEQNLEEMLRELTHENRMRDFKSESLSGRGDAEFPDKHMTDDRQQYDSIRAGRTKSADPFEWVRVDDKSIVEESVSAEGIENTDKVDVIIDADNESKSALQKVLDRFNETLDALKPDRDEKQKDIEHDIETEDRSETVREENDAYADKIELEYHFEDDIDSTQEEVTEAEPEPQMTADDELFKAFDLIQSDIEYDDNETDQTFTQQQGYDVGRSGKKYTTLELETLIRE